MKHYVYVNGIKFEQVQQAVDDALVEVDQGKHDQALAAAGIERPPGARFVGNAKLSQPQGLSPEQWVQIAIDFAPLVATMSKGVWDVVIFPKLKKLFREDRVSEQDPNRSNEKGGKQK